MSYKLEIAVSLGIVIIDQATKWFFTRQINSAGAFGLGEGLAFEALMLLALIVLGIYYSSSKNKLERLGLVLVMVSGISNLIDRFIYGGVRDFIYWSILNVYGNVADFVLVVGVGMLGWIILSDGR